MIISASRRTDIPAFYVSWLMNRIAQGFCLVANPFRPSQISRVSLLPEDVTAFVFWSKNPSPMLAALDPLDHRGYRYYFLVTVNDYPRELEPHLPPLAERIDTFIRLSDRLGPRRVIWRYDPIVLSNLTDTRYHQEHFEVLCRALSGHTERAMVSVVDFYKKTERRLGQLEGCGVNVQRAFGRDPGDLALLARLRQIASGYGIELRSCAEERDLRDTGILPGACIDGALIDALHRDTGRALSPAKKDPGQRAHCLCVASKDIGATDTCLHGCHYCYATVSDAAARRRHAEHDPEAPMLWQANR